MKVRTNIHGKKLIYLNEDTVCVLDQFAMIKLNQKYEDEFDYSTIYLTKNEIIQLAEELKKL